MAETEKKFFIYTADRDGCPEDYITEFTGSVAGAREKAAQQSDGEYAILENTGNVIVTTKKEVTVKIARPRPRKQSEEGAEDAQA